MRIININVLCKGINCIPVVRTFNQSLPNINKRKKKVTEINFTDADGFALIDYYFFRGLIEKTDSLINGENTIIELYFLSIYYINSYIFLLLHQLYCYLYYALFSY